MSSKLAPLLLCDSDIHLCRITLQGRGCRHSFARTTLQEIKLARRFVLNPHAHYDAEVEDEITAEIGDGIRAVEDFDLLLRVVKKDDFRKSNEDVEQASVGDMLSASIDP